MLAWILAAKSSKRKVALFSCACCRQLWDELDDDEIRLCLDAAERYADGLIRPRTAGTWWKRACAARDKLPGISHSPPRYIAYDCVSKAVASPEMGYVHNDVVAGILARTGTTPRSGEWPSKADAVSRRLIKLLRDVVGNPFRPAIFHPSWLTPTVLSLAQVAYHDRVLPSGEMEPIQLAILADALEEVGALQDITQHLRASGPHVRGCWAVDLLLCKS
jgi:hypothetical protein